MYQQMIDGFGLSEAEKSELLKDFCDYCDYCNIVGEHCVSDYRWLKVRLAEGGEIDVQ